MNTTLGLDTSSTPMVRRFRCSTLSPLTPGVPTRLHLWVTGREGGYREGGQGFNQALGRLGADLVWTQTICLT